MKKGKLIFGLLLGATAIVGGYMLYKRYKANKDAKGGGSGTTEPTTSPNTTTQTGGVSNTGVVNDGFPLKNGSRGSLVKNLQKALMILFPNSLPRFGADGIFGSETESALRSNGQPIVVDKTAYDRLIIASNYGKPASQLKDTGVASWF